jgi:N6-adenosine-specific RNA methylase IME4
MTTLIQYERACTALADAVSADEVMTVRLEAEALRAVARVAKNFDLEISAVKLRTRAEARLGEMLCEAEERGIINSHGGRRKVQDSAPESCPSASLKEIGVDSKLSSRARKLGGIGQRAVQAMLDRFDQTSRERGRLAMDVILGETAKRNAQSRRQLATELSDTSAHMPIGRKFPVIYADPAWSRKAGIGNRAYENHFPTMSWDDICTLPVDNLALPDAWLFLWMPRAHLLASTRGLYDLGRDGFIDIEMPLAWRVARAWGFPKYSTCLIWTKTDELHPDDHGTGLIAWDQDELLIMFKRGAGLPKPDSAVKFGSNHRERPREHSRKPDFYRHMIRTMAGDGMPVLELFARKDPANPWPADWHRWGNQAVDHDGDAEDLPPHDPETGELTDVAPRMSNVAPAPSGVPATASLPGAVKGAGHPFVDNYAIPDFLRRKTA